MLLGVAFAVVDVLQATDHMSADIPLFHSDSLRPLVVNSMQLAVQQLRQKPQAHDCEVRQGSAAAAAAASTFYVTAHVGLAAGSRLSRSTCALHGADRRA